MKKLSLLVSTLILVSSLLNADISIKPDWQLLGATQDLNISKFDSTCVDYIWKYDNTNVTNPWQLHVSNGNTYDYSGVSITSLNAGQGYWVKGNESCMISLGLDPDSYDDSDNNTTNIFLPISYKADAGRLLGSQCAQCHGTNGISSNSWDSIAGEDDLINEIFEDDEPIMNAQAHGYTNEEITLIGNWLKTLITNN